MKKYLLLPKSSITFVFKNFFFLKHVLTIIFLLIFFSGKAQLFNGTGGPILNNGQKTYFDLTVSGLVPSTLDSTFGIETLCITINHPVLREVTISLQSPDGRVVEMASGSSCSGENFTNTCFDSRGNSSITTATAPYTGSFKPSGFLGRFNNGQTGNGTWKLHVKDYLAFVNSGTLISWSISFGNAPPKPVKFASSNLPIVFINTGNQSISDNDLLATMGIIDNGTGQRNDTMDVRNNYNGKTIIHLRGNTSKNFEKKSYALELRDLQGNKLEVPLLGMPAESDWVLTASYADKSLMRNTIAYDLYRQMGHYSPRTKDVELIINNEYSGVYALTEKPKRGNDRIDISKLTSTENFFPEITGGYILKIDRPDEDGWYSLLGGNSQNNSSFYYQYVYPKDSLITIPQKNYINNFMDTLETVINSPYFANPVNGYQKYMDVSSFIDVFIINELSKNVDAYRLSTYLYKDNISKGGKLNIGPVWDYDIAWHNCNYGNSYSTNGWEYQLADTVYPSPAWWIRFFEDSNFVNRLYCRWNDLRQSILDITTLNNYLDASAAKLDEAQKRNFTQWPIIGAYISPNPQTQLNASYQTEVTDIKNWIASRVTWMDANITGICQNVGITEQLDFTKPDLTGFPNPFSTGLSIIYTVPERLPINNLAQVKIELLNMLGEQVKVIFNGNKTAGKYSEEVDTQQLAAGLYLIKLSVNTSAVYQKVVKLEEK